MPCKNHNHRSGFCTLNCLPLGAICVSVFRIRHQHRWAQQICASVEKLPSSDLYLHNFYIYIESLWVGPNLVWTVSLLLFKVIVMSLLSSEAWEFVGKTTKKKNTIHSNNSHYRKSVEALSIFRNRYLHASSANYLLNINYINLSYQSAWCCSYKNQLVFRFPKLACRR